MSNGFTGITNWEIIAYKELTGRKTQAIVNARLSPKNHVYETNEGGMMYMFIVFIRQTLVYTTLELNPNLKTEMLEELKKYREQQEYRCQA